MEEKGEIVWMVSFDGGDIVSGPACSFEEMSIEALVMLNNGCDILEGVGAWKSDLLRMNKHFSCRVKGGVKQKERSETFVHKGELLFLFYVEGLSIRCDLSERIDEMSDEALAFCVSKGADAIPRIGGGFGVVMREELARREKKALEDVAVEVEQKQQKRRI
jgi:hypothetical protein